MKRKEYFIALILISIVFGVGVWFFGSRLTAEFQKAFISQVHTHTLLNGRNLIKNTFLPDEFSIYFVGDVMLSRGVALKIKNEGAGDTRFPFLKIEKELRDADILFGNLEGPISSRGANQGSIYSFRANPTVVEGLTYAGFDVMSLANNHMWDWGKDALNDTVTHLMSNEIIPVGAGADASSANEPKFIEKDGVSIAFIAYTNLYPKSLEAGEVTSGISHFDLESAKKTVSDLKLKADIIAVSFHWGDEYKLRSNTLQQKIARALVDAGADVVVGHHPHVIQEIEKYREGWIIYSLGNFVFDQDFSDDVKNGLMVKAVIKDKKIKEIIPYRTRTNKNFQPELIGI